MTGLTQKRKRTRVIIRPSSILTRVVITATIVLSIAALLTLRTTQASADARVEDLKSQAAQQKQENDRLEQNIDNLGSLDSVEQIAKDELGLVNPDSVVITPNP